MISTTDREDVADACAHLAERRLSRNECKSLLITLREEFDSGSTTRDLADSVAHRVRNRGIASKYLDRFATRWKLARLAKEPIDIGPLYPIDEVFHDLFTTLDHSGVEYNRQGMLAATYQLVSTLGWVLNEREIYWSKDEYCLLIGDVGVDSRFVQPGYVFNSLTLHGDDECNSEQEALPGMPASPLWHSHFAGPLLKNYFGTVTHI